MDRGRDIDAPVSGHAGLEAAIDRVAKLLPEQGPITTFIHQNPLHSFEGRPFDEAVIEAGALFGCKPFLDEDRYRNELARGRISRETLRAVLAEELGERSAECVAGLAAREDLRLWILTHGIRELSGPPLLWVLHDAGALDGLRSDVPACSRRALGLEGSAGRTRREAPVVRELWRASLDVVARSRPDRSADGLRRLPSSERLPRLLRDALGIDVDALVHPLLIRFVGAFLDQGLAHWPLEGRDAGLRATFLRTYGRPIVRHAGVWLRDLPRIAGEDAPHTALESLAGSLRTLGVSEAEQERFLLETALALRGWAGMVRQVETRPDRVPVEPVPASLAEYLSVQLLLERAALRETARSLGESPDDLAGWRERLAACRPDAEPPSDGERAWPVFQVAQLGGIDASRLDRLSADACRELEDELRGFDGAARRRVLHGAFEWDLRSRLFDALARRVPQEPPAPSFQAIFCIDEREESVRRHLEIIAPTAETLGAAGFFGIAMYYRGAADARPRPLCPPQIRPEHFVAEERERIPGTIAALGRGLGRAMALADKNVHVGSRTLARGALVMSLLGPLSLIPLILRVVAPGLGRRAAGFLSRPQQRPRSSLLLVHRDGDRVGGLQAGFTTGEMAAIVEEQLSNLGIAHRLADTVFVAAHASVSLNNPHESAHDCGACGGGAGGPNARAFAKMANDPVVRSALAERGLSIPPETWFVGAEHNTASSEMRFFDLDVVPASARSGVQEACNALRMAAAADALERSRRFQSAPHTTSTRDALRHVQARSADLAQPRPEYGHATNAYCIVGRRSRTRGLFLDRRAFLASYDATLDPRGEVLRRTLKAVLPVVAGISLEYFFSTVDPRTYGCGTKLPHNVTAFLGVMDGAQSDLRTGLPWQMVEIHEPVRLTLVVECSLDAMREVLAQEPPLGRLVENRWLFVACLDPSSGELVELSGDAARRHRAAGAPTPVRPSGVAWLMNERGHLPIAEISDDARTDVRA